MKLGKTRILHDIGLDLVPGEMTAIVGPNGSGKTTLMRALSGEARYTGSIAFHGEELSGIHTARLALLRAVLPQSSNLAFPFTVREIVNLGVHIKDETQRKARGDEALAIVDLEGFASRFYQELSGGEQQRVQLARVLCQVWEPVLDGRPRWLLLDEPVSSLDIKHQLIIMEVAKHFAQRGGGTLAIMHDLNLSAMFADKIAVLSRGRLAAFGVPDDVICNDVMRDVFDVDLAVNSVPESGQSYILPQAALRTAGAEHSPP